MPRKILGVIPARFGSTRFPGKVLALLSSKTVLQHVYERACQSRYLSSTIIATDDERVYEAARSFGAPVRMTRADHASGTDRVAEVASAEEATVVVNIQGDEPLIDPAAIDAAILPVVHDSDVVMATLKKKIEDPREIEDPNVVKVVTNRAGDAIYFSRCAIPYRAGSRAAPGSNISGFTCTGAIFCSAFRNCRWARSNAPSAWSNCARSKTATPYGWSKPTTSRWAWIRPRTSNGSRGSSKLP